MNNETFERLDRGNSTDQRIVEKGMKLTGIVMGVGTGLVTLGALGTPVNEINNYMHPLIKVGGAILGAGGVSVFLTGCYIMARDIYRNDIMGYQEARQGRLSSEIR